MSENETVHCADCSDEITDDSGSGLDHGIVCETCRDDNYSSCDDCSDIVSNDDTHAVNNGNSWVCTDCRDNSYSSCEDCEDTVHNDYICWVGSDRHVCDDCRDNSYYYCDSCGEYYHGDDGPCCSEDACDCEAPAQRFSIRNDGALLDNDQRTTIGLPAGFVSDEGMGAISRLIRESAPPVAHDRYNDGTSAYNESITENSKWRDLAYTLVDGVGTEWQRKDGNFTKRLSRYAHKNYAIKITPAILTAVGNIGSQHSQGATHNVEVTRDLNQSAEDFGHGESCWWQSYYESRCTLKSNGGFGLRAFDTVRHERYEYQTGPWSHDFGRAYTPVGFYESDEVTGRAWVIPLRLVDGTLVQTFDAENADAYVAFNGYGTLGGYAAARILGQMTGSTYRKVSMDIDNHGYENNPIYVNADAGYLVGPESIVDDYTDGSLLLSLDVHSNLYSHESRMSANV